MTGRLQRNIFPDAEIKADPSITGGIDADAEDGRIRIVNTFEKEKDLRGWTDMLPEIIRDVRQVVDSTLPNA